METAASEAQARKKQARHSRVDAVRGGDDPALVEQRASAGDPLAQERLLDDGRLPRVRPEAGVAAAHDPVGAGVGLSTLCGKGRGQGRSAEGT